MARGSQTQTARVARMLKQNPSLSYGECKSRLEKKGMTINNSTFYTVRARLRKASGATGSPRATKRATVVSSESDEMATELAMLQRENMKLRAVIATLLQ